MSGEASLVAPVADARVVCAAIARAVLGAEPGPDAVGAVELREHQRAVVGRLRDAIGEFGGALLADEAGLGKTYVALALFADAPSLLVIAPAAIEPMWRDACRRAGRDAVHFVSVEWLSAHGAAPPCDASAVIVDEAHHLRTAGTRRYRAAAELAAGRPTLLLSATPVHNRAGDLRALLALFAGSGALSPADVARCVVRRERAIAGSADRLPRVEPPAWLDLPDDATVLDALVAMPPPVPPADGGLAAALTTYTLVRQWSSSAGALAAALVRRVATATAMDDALAAGRHPTRRELASWVRDDGAVQLGFPGLLAATAMPEPCALREALAAHVDALRVARAVLRQRGDAVDDARAAWVREIRRRHGGERVVAFTAYADTVAALWRRLAGDRGVAALTGGGARVAGGRLTRAEAIARFAPMASGCAPARAADDVTLLVTTDLLSEGVNLTDASVVVHLDLPWTPARLEQRVGRCARLGSPHERVAVYAMRPPAPAERLVLLERRLREKLRAAAVAVGAIGPVVPGLADEAAWSAPPSAPSSAPSSDAATRVVLARWRGAATPGEPRPCRGAAVAPLAGPSPRAPAFIAAVRDAATTRLVVRDAAGVSDDPARVAAVVRALDESSPLLSAAVEQAERAIGAAARELDDWLASREAAEVAGIDAGGAARVRRRVVARISTITGRAPAHLRTRLASLAHEARRVAGVRCGAGGERVLDELLAARMPDEAWLTAVGAFAATFRASRAAGPVRLLALLAIEPPA